MFYLPLSLIVTRNHGKIILHGYMQIIVVKNGKSKDILNSYVSVKHVTCVLHELGYYGQSRCFMHPLERVHFKSDVLDSFSFRLVSRII